MSLHPVLAKLLAEPTSSWERARRRAEFDREIEQLRAEFESTLEEIREARRLLAIAAFLRGDDEDRPQRLN
jgi:hypothetical protein